MDREHQINEEKERLKKHFKEEAQARRERRKRSARDVGLGIIFGAAAAITITTWTGFLTTQSVVERVRQDDAATLASLRAEVCAGRFAASPNAGKVLARIQSLDPKAQRAELRRYIAARRLALMDTDTKVQPGIPEKCVEDIRES